MAVAGLLVLSPASPAAAAGTPGGELVVTPATDLPKGSDLTVVVRYADVPSEAKDENGYTPWVRKPDVATAVVLDIPRWMHPGNDHPTDKAVFDFSVAVPDGVPGGFRWRADQSGS
ncbi:hypothetical protein [Kibdelosporangium phytohabitans]|uniref:hypothetical protein n=1 Tax=Kibdelosporangium phytohabitans TaxID=860235 RepID=UPI00178B4D35|nr:hypothetical protein [Kibdelosporangium phytohabitans]MBE1465712.1 hypothetical protein [Kibdelosporangium phytohabitans]